MSPLALASLAKSPHAMYTNWRLNSRPIEKSSTALHRFFPRYRLIGSAFQISVVIADCLSESKQCNTIRRAVHTDTVVRSVLKVVQSSVWKKRTKGKEFWVAQRKIEQQFNSSREMHRHSIKWFLQCECNSAKWLKLVYRYIAMFISVSILLCLFYSFFWNRR